MVDLKGVPECTELGESGGELRIGAACSLAELGEARPWPLLAAAADRVADHISRCRITFGGNVARRIRYREAALPLLVSGTRAVIASPDGALREEPFADVFDGALGLADGEFLVQVRLPRSEANLPFFALKRTRLDWIDYPLLSVVAVRREGRIRVAFSGLCADPFRSPALEEPLSDPGVPEGERIAEATRRLRGPVLEDMHGSADYRRFLLQGTLRDALHALA